MIETCAAAGHMIETHAAAGPDPALPDRLSIALDSGPVLSFALDWRPGRPAFACRSKHRISIVRRGQQ